jgi:signal transduction histidine kinase
MASAAGGVASRKEFLQRLPLFEGLSPSDLQRLCRIVEEIRVPAGELVFEEGAPGDGLLVIVEGQLEVTKREAGQDLVLALRGPGEVIGEMSLLENVPRTASVRAVRDSVLLSISPGEFERLLAGSPSAATAILRTMTGRLRSTEALLMQREKLASLGTLAAGLAHELNNPAAAIQRSSAHLRDVLREWDERGAALGALELTPEQTRRLSELRGAVAGCGVASDDALACSRDEDRLVDWLEARGFEEPWEVAPPLAAYGFTVERMSELTEAFAPDQLLAVVGWLSAGLGAQGLLEEIGQSAKLVSDIVKAVKTYSYLDQAPIQEVDLRESLENTLMILRHRLKEGVEVTRDFAPDLPPVEAFGSELNQVWTNIIDNAIDAMDGTGAVEIGARRVGADHVEVEIADNGPVIPEEILPHIFDPFLTTKPPGVGSGLGLHIAYNIVVSHHRGRIDVESRPGRTVFRVTLPIERPRE